MEFSVYKDNDVKSANMFYFISNIDKCDTKQALLDWFTPHQRKTLVGVPKDIKHEDIIVVKDDPVAMDVLCESVAIHIPNEDKNIELLSLTDPTNECEVYGVHRLKPDIVLLFKIAKDASLPPFRFYDQFMLQEGMIDNYKGEPVKTDVGKFFINELVLVKPFGDMIPYINGTIDPEKLDDIVAELILNKKVTRKQYNHFVNNCFWYGEDGTLSVTTWTEKAISLDPKITQRKKELFEQYKDQLDDPVVLSKIEQELIKMDKESLKGDPSESFYVVGGKKIFNDARKKMWITCGLSTTFGDDNNKYELISNSLDEGFTPESLPTFANSMRKGSYFRGKETAKGGDQTKFVLRAFQNMNIEEEDCHSTKGLKIVITSKNKKMFLGRWTVKGELITKENLDNFVGKEIEIRSPMYCKTKPGLCYKCCGELFKKLEMSAIGMNELMITSTFMNTAMKLFHSTSVDAKRIIDFHRFLK